MEKKEVEVSVEDLKKKDNPTNADLDAIAEAARAESAKEQELENETPEQKTEREATEKEEKESKAREELDVRAKEAGLEPGASEEDIEVKEKEAGKFKETEEAKSAREKAETDQKEAFDKEVKDFATEHKVPEEDARKELEHIGKVGEKYGHDPKKLAKANLQLQRELVKIQEKAKVDARPAPVRAEQIPLDTMVKLIEDGKLTSGDKALSKEHIIKSFRDQYPDITEDLEDTKVIQMAAKELRDQFIAQDKLTLEQIEKVAKARREELIAALDEDDKSFKDIIQPMLEKTPDSTVLEKEYDLDALLRFARGDKEVIKSKIDAAYQRGLKQGKEEAVILGNKPPIGGGAPSSKKDTGSVKISKLTSDQKKRANEMFDNQDAFPTEDSRFLAYIETDEYLDTQKK